MIIFAKNIFIKLKIDTMKKLLFLLIPMFLFIACNNAEKADEKEKQEQVENNGEEASVKGCGHHHESGCTHSHEGCPHSTGEKVADSKGCCQGLAHEDCCQSGNKPECEHHKAETVTES